MESIHGVVELFISYRVETLAALVVGAIFAAARKRVSPVQVVA
jgi:hypothetical protein